MEDSIKENLPPSFRLDLASIALPGMHSFIEMEHLWNNDIPQIIPHDCSVMGEAALDTNGITIQRIFLQRGVFNEDPDVLMVRCASLLATWNVMRNACLMDLGPCACIGQRLFNREADETRSFLIHGSVITENKILFLIFSSAGWKEEGAMKRIISKLMEPMAETIQRLAEPHDVGTNSESTPSEVRLTAREIEIINWLVEGQTNKEIARSLGTSPNTVRNQIARLAQKSGARNRAQLAALVASLR